MQKALHIKISGRVQMVGFRYAALELAKELDLTGWVKNVQDGTVEILAIGDEKNLKKLLGWAHSGPTGAHVEDVEYRWEEIKDKFNNFKIVAS